MTRLLSLAIMLLATLPAFGQIALPEKQKIAPGFVVVRPITTGKTVKWHVPAVAGVSKVPPELISDPKVLILFVDSQIKTKQFTVFCWTAVNGEPSDAATCLLYLGAEPGPGPGPEPGPDPDPTPDPTPTPTDSLHVLITEEAMDRPKLPAKQLSILFSLPFREYLRSVCAPDPQAGDGKAYRIWDKDVDTKYIDQKWDNALQTARKLTTPSIIIFDGTKVLHSGELPGTVDATIELIKKWRK